MVRCGFVQRFPTAFDTITDWTSGYKIDSTTSALSIAVKTAATATSAAISSTGLATFDATDNTLAKKLIAVAAGIANGTTGVTANTGTPVAGNTAVFVDGSDTYVFISDATAAVGATDVLIKLTGIAATTGLVLDGSGDIITIA